MVISGTTDRHAMAHPEAVGAPEIIADPGQAAHRPQADAALAVELQGDELLCLVRRVCGAGAEFRRELVRDLDRQRHKDRSSARSAESSRIK